MTSHAESMTTHLVDTRYKKRNFTRKEGNIGQGTANSSLQISLETRYVVSISVRSDWLRF